MKKFLDWLNHKNQTTNKDNIMPPPLPAQEAVYFLQEYLLGEDWYSVNPINTEQINCEIVADILFKYSKKFRKELKLHKKELNYIKRS